MFSGKWKSVFCALALLCLPLFAEGNKDVQAIGPLLVADPRQPGWETRGAWGDFRNQLAEAKALGISSISVDVWWGLVQRNNSSEFDWSYYDKLFDEITRAGLKVIPILSIHQCGGNVGDDVYIPLPPWFIEKMKPTATRPDLAFLSEAGNRSDEFASVWATPYVLDDYKRFWGAFKERYGRLGKSIPKVIVGMGPASELVYPSYHMHDRSRGFYAAFVPNRGSLQASSDLAQENLREFLREKYKTIEALNEAWGGVGHYSDFAQIRLLTTSQEVDAFFGAYRQYSQMGKDFFEWYHGSLMEHGYRLAAAATEIFQVKDSPFQESLLGFKIPGIHWRFGDRLAQVTAGLIQTKSAQSTSDVPLNHRWPSDWVPDQGHGYGDLFDALFGRLRTKYPWSHWVGIFTCGEMPNAGDSGAFDLVRAIGRTANEKKVPFYLENALAENLFSGNAIRILTSHLRDIEYFHGISLLRLRQALQSEAVKQYLRGHHAHADTRSCPQELLVLNNAASPK